MKRRRLGLPGVLISLSVMSLLPSAHAAADIGLSKLGFEKLGSARVASVSNRPSFPCGAIADPRWRF